MRTKGGAIVDDLESAIAQLRALDSQDHDVREVNEVLVMAGTRLELFFKDALFPDATKKDGADAVINRLKSVGVSKEGRADLHEAREACNNSKHDARFGISIDEAVIVLEKAVLSIKDLIHRNIDGISQPLLKGALRTFWIGAWDHFIHGDTEVHVMLPWVKNGWAPQFDTYNIAIDSWDSFKSELGVSLKFGKQFVDGDFYESCAKESDFLDAGEFQGEYRVLSAALSKRLVNEDKLLPGLRRQDDRNGAIAAICMAAVDIARANPELSGTQQFELQLLKVIEQEYALSQDSALSRALSPVLSNIILSASEQNRAKISGPLWVDELGFARYASRGGFTDDPWKIGLDPHGVLFAILRAN